MTGYDAALVNLIDSRIRASQQTDRAVGTYVGVDATGVFALVTFDGDDRPMPCKWAAGLGWLVPDTRVALDRYGSDWWVTAALSGKDYWPKRAANTTAVTSITNTSPAVGAQTVGFDFKAPLTGAVWVTVGGQCLQSNNGNTTYLSYQVRTGADYATGQNVQAFSTLRAIAGGAAVMTGGVPNGSGTHRWPLEGLVPGESYSIRTGHWTTPAGAGTVNARYLSVEPFI